MSIPTKRDETESWNGTSFTELNDLNVARDGGAGAGNTTTDGIYAGGYTTTIVATVEEWTGAGANIGGWTTSTALNTARDA